MIDIAEKKFSRKNLNFECKSVFNYQPNSVFDVISANGFIEYLSINQIKNFIKFCKKNLKKNGFLILGSLNIKVQSIFVRITGLTSIQYCNDNINIIKMLDYIQIN